jgi:putative transcriptional regulator
MAISYKPLWKLLIDRNMKKKDLIALSGVSQSSVSKMGRGENVNTDILNRICLSLNCSIADIVEVIPEGNEELPPASEEKE